MLAEMSMSKLMRLTEFKPEALVWYWNASLPVSELPLAISGSAAMLLLTITIRPARLMNVCEYCDITALTTEGEVVVLRNVIPEDFVMVPNTAESWPSCT